MSEVLKGNFSVKKKVVIDDSENSGSLKEEFEKTAMRRLGGSIAFAAPKTGFVWKETEDVADRENQ